MNLALPNCRGFTLIELMVVLALIGILTAVIIPEMKGTYQDALLRSSSRDLINVFDVTYSRAVSLNQVRRVCLDEKNGRYMVERQVIDAGQENYEPVDDAGCKGELNSRITMAFHRHDQAADADQSGATEEAPAMRPEQAAGNGQTEQGADVTATISFYPDGTADPGVIELTDTEGFGLELKINPITARVQVEELARQ